VIHGFHYFRLKTFDMLLVLFFNMFGFLLFNKSLNVLPSILQLSFGPIGWLMISEIFPLKLRGRGLSLAVLVNFGANALVTFAFSPLKVTYHSLEDKNSRLFKLGMAITVEMVATLLQDFFTLEEIVNHMVSRGEILVE